MHKRSLEKCIYWIELTQHLQERKELFLQWKKQLFGVFFLIKYDESASNKIDEKTFDENDYSVMTCRFLFFYREFSFCQSVVFENYSTQISRRSISYIWLTRRESVRFRCLRSKWKTHLSMKKEKHRTRFEIINEKILNDDNRSLSTTFYSLKIGRISQVSTSSTNLIFSSSTITDICLIWSSFFFSEIPIRS